MAEERLVVIGRRVYPLPADCPPVARAMLRDVNNGLLDHATQFAIGRHGSEVITHVLGARAALAVLVRGQQALVDTIDQIVFAYCQQAAATGRTFP